jgi:hypothetical protein
MAYYACWAQSSTLTVKAIFFSNMAVNFYQTTRHHIPEDNTSPTAVTEQLTFLLMKGDKEMHHYT